MSTDFSDLGATPLNNFSDLGATPVNASISSHPFLNSLGAAGLGAAGGLASVLQNASRYLNPGYQLVEDQLKNQNLQLPNIEQALSQTQLAQQHPNYYEGGKIGGETLPFLLGAGELSFPEMIGMGAAQGALTDTNHPIEGGLLGAGLSTVIPGAAGAVGLGGRFLNVSFKDAKKLSDLEGNSYDAIRNEANDAGFKANLNNYGNVLNFYKNAIDQQPQHGVYQPISNDIGNRLDAIPSDMQKEEGTTVGGMHSLIRGLNDVIGKYIRSGDNDYARVYSNIRDAAKGDLVNSLNDQGLPHLADQFLDSQRNWAQNIVPLLQNPVSLSKVGRQAAVMGVLPHLGMPWPVEGAAAAALGVHDTNPIASAIRRFGSSYGGGPGQTFMNAQLLGQPVARASISAWGNNQ